MLQQIRILLYPFSILYGLILALRNKLFDAGLLSSYQSSIRTVCIGNLSVGGTGKTPFTEFLIESYSKDRKIAVVSRGYRRKTSGFRYVDKDNRAEECGDEILQLKRKYPDVLMAVSEKRAVALKQIEKDHPEIELILLDDAFQHRSVRAHVNILLTTRARPYFNDHVLPSGNLREWTSGSHRADFIVVTKCPQNMTDIERLDIQQKINPLSHQKLFFSEESYGKPYGIFDREEKELNMEAALLVSGIADDSSLRKHLSLTCETIDVFNLEDHVEYDGQLVKRIKNRYLELDLQFLSCVITTEKDAVKLKEFSAELDSVPVYVIPYAHKIRKEEEFLRDLTNKISV